MKHAECTHLLQVKLPNIIYPPNILLHDESLAKLSSEGKYKLGKDSTIQDCKKLHELCSNKNKQAIVSFDDSTRYRHFSVQESNINYFSKFGRVIVTADKLLRSFFCGCCTTVQRTCTHKAMCMWLMIEEGSFGNFYDSSINLNIQNDAEDTAMEDLSLIYPPHKPEIIKNMCEYLYEHKRYNKNEAHSPPPPLVTEYPQEFIPLEKECVNCKIPLGRKCLITNRGKLYTTDKVISNVSSFFRKCSGCKQCYRYQESTHGVHNFNDMIFLSIEFCEFLTNCLKEHIAIGSIVKVLAKKYGENVSEKWIFNANLHYLSLLGESHPFFLQYMWRSPANSYYGFK